MDYGLSRYHDNIAFGKLCRLLCRHYDIRIVRKHENVPGIRLLNRLGYRIDAGIHCLSAGDELVRSKALESLVDSASDADGDNAYLLFAGLKLCFDLPVLLAHILNLDLVNLSEAERKL